MIVTEATRHRKRKRPEQPRSLSAKVTRTPAKYPEIPLSSKPKYVLAIRALQHDEKVESVMPEVAFVTTRYVDPGQETTYTQWSKKIDSALANAPGYIRSEQISATASGQPFWTQIIRFVDKPASIRWQESDELATLQAEVEEFTRDTEVSAVRTGKSDWLNFGFSTKPGPGAPVKWKQLLAGVMALYPTVVIVHEILSALFTIPFALSTLLTNAIAMSLVMLIWLPQLSKALGFWLMPKDTLPARTDVGVAAGILAVIAVLTVVFLAVFG
jgi:antibiotic biosynthesis monooxygenase (ABM) superfamily enzyme